MGNNQAWEAITAPEPNARQRLIVFVAEACLRRFPHRNKSHAEDVTYILAVLLRWKFITSEDVVNMGRTAYGRLVSDIMSAWDIMLGKDLPTNGPTDKPPYVAYNPRITARNQHKD